MRPYIDKTEELKFNNILQFLSYIVNENLSVSFKMEKKNENKRELCQIYCDRWI